MTSKMTMVGKTGISRTGAALAICAALALTGCGSGFGQNEMDPETRRQLEEAGALAPRDRDTIWDLFRDNDNPNVTVEVNRYLWNASLEILDFMPIEAADPFSGVLSFGYGTPPGGGTAYRATVFVTDPALEARSLRVALQSRSGAVNRETARQIEDAILTRARQLRIRDGRL
ncbi:MAG: protein of unknown function containing DUF3576 domain [Rhodobacteraceae bacterium HLUCCO18]|nr:MAG: protein of unknown function containing DUF3576 domain [Rhodobacteraceae bacterium HLUCCO18]